MVSLEAIVSLKLNSNLIAKNARNDLWLGAWVCPNVILLST